MSPERPETPLREQVERLKRAVMLAVVEMDGQRNGLTADPNVRVRLVRAVDDADATLAQAGSGASVAPAEAQQLEVLREIRAQQKEDFMRAYKAEATLADFRAFVEKLAATEICDDPVKAVECEQDSGPYCGSHLFDDYIVKEARQILALVSGLAPKEPA